MDHRPASRQKVAATHSFAQEGSHHVGDDVSREVSAPEYVSEWGVVIVGGGIV